MAAMISAALAALSMWVPAPAPAPAAAQPPARAEAEIEASRAAVAAVDVERLATDEGYAGEMLAHLDRLDSLGSGDPRMRGAMEALRLFALGTLGRRDDIVLIVDRFIQRRSRAVEEYAGPLYAAVQIEDWGRSVALVEAASRSVPGIAWAELRDLLGRDTMWALLGQLDADGEGPLRVRLAESLFRIGWPGDAMFGSADPLRLILIEDRLRRGEAPAAAEYATGIVSPHGVLPLIVQRRYDEVLGPGRERLDLLRESLEEQDRATAAALAASPQDPKRLLDRIQYLRSVDRAAEAIDLAAPHMRDVPATVRAGEDGMWLVNEAAYALLSTGRTEQALALMGEMAAMPLSDDPELISAHINHAAILLDAGRPAQSLEVAQRLDLEAGDHASDYGKMWILDAIVCSLAQLDRAAEAAPWMERMRAMGDSNPSALTLAYLCLGDDEAAALLMVRRLGDEDPSSAILALQDYELSRGPGQIGPFHARLVALRERPEVRAALDRVGRVLTLPLARTYWGNF